MLPGKETLPYVWKQTIISRNTPYLSVHEQRLDCTYIDLHIGEIFNALRVEASVSSIIRLSLFVHE